MGEIARVLKPGGSTMITWFLLNEESERADRGAARPPSRSRPNAHVAAVQPPPRGLPGDRHRGARVRGRPTRRTSCATQYRANGLEIVEPVDVRRLGAGGPAPATTRTSSCRPRLALDAGAATSAGISRAMRERGTTRSNPGLLGAAARVDVHVRVEAERGRARQAGHARGRRVVEVHDHQVRIAGRRVAVDDDRHLVPRGLQRGVDLRGEEEVGRDRELPGPPEP